MADMVNLGPSLKAMPDLRSTRFKEDAAVSRLGKEDAPGSFEKVLAEKTDTKTDSKKVIGKEKNEETGTLAKDVSGAQKKIGKQSGTNESVKGTISKGEKKVEKKADSKTDSDTVSKTDDSDEIAETPVEKPLTGLNKLTKVESKLSDRQRVMKKFMDSMESEFNIAPEDIVGAMAQLSDKELLLSPEQTAPQIIEKLDLTGQDATKAEAMYLAMAVQLSALNNQPKLAIAKTMVPEMAAGATGMALLAAKDRRQMLNDSLDKMNSKFFLKPEMKLPTEVVEPGMNSANEFKTELTDTGGKFDIPKDFQAVDPKPLKMETGLDPRAMKPQSDVRTEDLRTALLELGAAAGALKSAMAQEKNALTETTENSSPMMMAPTLKQPESIKVMEATPNLSANAEQMLAALAAGSKAQDMYGKSGNGSSSFGSTGKEPMSEEKSGLAKAQGANADFVMPNMMPAKEFGSPQVGATAMGGAAAAAGATRPGAEADAQSNVQALIKQAQYMIKKGGGEASVKMNPEGMGQVHLRIMVSEGKVNVEFKTETAEAKKMLESNIGDLKNSLSIHRLAVDHVKVDVGNQLANSSDHKPGQEQQQFKQDPQREQARQFFNQFHEDNSARREGYYDTKGAKAYSRSKPVEALRPGDDAQSVQTRRDLGTGRGSGLDLVA